MEAIQYQSLPCNTFSDLWHTLHSSYNTAVNHPIQLSVLDDVSHLVPQSWILSFMLEMQEALKACSNVSALGPDHITWYYLKYILSNDTCSSGILFLANLCITL